ncbi:MAG: cysteine--tRNA ligase [Planctomycetes bacterium]|nr:cysteine--tRNA ligase [Planctomycetota bacterium]
MIQVYNTEARKKAPLEPVVPGHVNMYVCGPTVYDSCHIGHARPAVVFDTIRRHLEYSGLSVTFISNITDIDDKIINRANELGITCKALAGRYQDEYESDMARLGVRSPTIRPKATEHIGEMIDLIKGLEEKGIAYVTPRGVWFDVSKFADYGKLSGRKTDDENTEHRVEQDQEKKNPQDFALWKFSKPGEPEWDSPWGKGRPGWHIECSAMSGKYCDFQLDIHGGGADLSFPHHENEIAQSEAYTGKQFVKYWMHNGFITVGKDDDDEEIKMGKSKGNAFWLHDAFEVASPAALRMWILGTHYRGPLLYKPEFLKTGENSLDRIYNCLEAITRYLGEGGIKEAVGGETGAFSEECENADKAFREAMDDDFNTPQALAVVYELVGKANSAVTSGASKADCAKALLTIHAHLGVLGLPVERPKDGGAGADQFIKLLIEIRTEARKNKDFALSDKIRDDLAAMGVVLNDRSGETTWTAK